MNSRVLEEIDDHGVARFTLNRPDVHNALDDETMTALTAAVVRANRSHDVRVVVISGAGDTFCAGTDIAWMEQLSADEPSADARRLGNTLWQIRACTKPTLAQVNGPAYGAGLALATACDISVADDEAVFSLPAVRLGAIPAVIAPFLLESVSIAHLRRYGLTGEEFSAEEARRVGFISATCLGAQLDETVAGMIENLLKGSPAAQKEFKSLLNDYGRSQLSSGLIEGAAKISARLRRTAEAREALAAFIEKRPPDWQR